MQSFKSNDFPIKRKKTRSLNQRVKKKFKKYAEFSKGKRLELSEYQYFVRVFELWNSFRGSNDEIVVFANNALAQTDNKEVECSFNQLVSRVIEELIPFASNTVLERYFKAFEENFRRVCVNDYSSHVLQTLMLTASQHLMAETSQHLLKCEEWLLKVSRFLLNNIEEFMWDMYANPCLRTAIFCLAGMHYLDQHFKHREGQKMDEIVKKPPEIFVQLLEKFYIRIKKWPQFKELVHNPLASRYLQCLLQTLKPNNKKKYNGLCKKILEECFSASNGSNPILSSPTALPVLEIMINQGNRTMLKKIYDQFLYRNLAFMATASVGKFTLQTFINKCDDTHMIAAMVTALSPEFSKVLAFGNTALIVSLSQACERLGAAQSELYQGLAIALNCDGPDTDKNLVYAILYLRPLNRPNQVYTKHGALVLQSLLKFQKPIKLVNSLLLFEPKQLADLFSTPYGSYIPGTFCNSEYIGEKSRRRLIHQLMGYYSHLAKSKFGSRSFDNLWDAADMKAKENIVGDLAKYYAGLKSSHFGKFIVSKTKLDDFRNLGVMKWRSSVQSVHSKKKLCAQFVGNLQ